MFKAKTSFKDEVITVADGAINPSWWCLNYDPDITDDELLDFKIRNKLCDFDPADANLESYTTSLFHEGHKYILSYPIYKSGDDDYDDAWWEVANQVDVRKVR